MCMCVCVCVCVCVSGGYDEDPIPCSSSSFPESSTSQAVPSAPTPVLVQQPVQYLQGRYQRASGNTERYCSPPSSVPTSNTPARLGFGVTRTITFFLEPPSLPGLAWLGPPL